MPDLDRRLLTLQRAVLAFRATPGRRGRLVALEDASDVLVGGDLHGSVDNFRRLLVHADLVHHPRRHFVVQEVVHGPQRYPLGGDRSHQLLDLIAALKCQFPHQVHLLVGNHELAQSTGRPIGKEADDLLEDFDRGVVTAYGERAADVLAVYRELLHAAPFALRTPNRVFLSHSLPAGSRLAGFDPAALERDVSPEADLIPGGALYSLVWGRDMSAATAAEFLRRVDADLLVTGHMPCDDGFAAPSQRQLVLDCSGPSPCYCLFPADRPLSHAELLGCVRRL